MMSVRFHFVKLLTRVVSESFPRSLTTVSTSKIKHVAAPLPHILSSSNPWIWQMPEPIKVPVSPINSLILPNELFKIPPINEPDNNISNTIIEEPLQINNNSKEAARLIVIRRKKMKKHKLKKLRKRMKYEWAKLRQRRELKKEKEFQAGLIAQCKEAEMFSAEEYVANKIKLATEKPPLPFTQTDEYKELMRRKRLRLDVNK